MMNKLVRLCLLLTTTAASAITAAQENANRHTTNAILFGIGKSNLYDTYLSPFAYTGPHAAFLYETLRPTRWADGKVSVQTVFDGFGAYAASPAGNNREIGGMLNYSAGWHYNFNTACGLRIATGGSVHAGGGATYNLRNGNNPVQANARAYIAASAMAIYPLAIRNTQLHLRYQLTVPLAGAMFSPRYGQSYYEMSLGNYDHNVCFIYPGNAPSMQHFITVDLPIRKRTVRLGYRCDIFQSRVNGIDAHTWNHTFFIGYVRHLRIFSAKEAQKQPFIM